MNQKISILKTSIGTFLIILAFFLSPGRGFGQLLVDDFTGLTVGANLAGQSSWTKGGGGPDATIANATTLTYPSYNGGGAEYVLMPAASGTASRVYKGFTSTASGTNTFYYSVLIRLTAATATGEYFISLGDPTTGSVYFARLFAKASGAGFVIGGSKLANVATANFGTTVFSYSTTYLVVARYSCVTGSTNDLMYVWVNPGLSSEPATGSAEVTVTATIADGAPTNVGNFHWHNRTANNPTGSFDGVRVAYGATSAAAWTSLAALTGLTAPLVTTTDATAIGVTGATFNGNITSNGGSSITDRGFCYKTGPGVTIGDNKTTAGGAATGTYNLVMSTLSGETHYYYRAYAENGTGTTLSSTEINFWTFSPEPSSHSTTFTNSVASQTQIDLSFDAASTITNADGYIILRKIGSAPASLPADGSGYTQGTTFGDATVAAVITSNSATTASVSGLAAGTHYYFAIYPFNWNATDAATYNYKTNGTIPATDGTTLPSLDLTSEVSGPAAGSQPNPLVISSLITSGVSAVRVFDMDLHDYGTDGQPTKVTQITIKAGPGNTANWLTSIMGAKLFRDGGSTFVFTSTPVITANSIVFPIPSGNLNIPDASTFTLSMYIYLNASGLTDNQVLQFKVDAAASSHGWIADATGSTFLATFASGPVSNQVKIDVTATKMKFVQQPSNTLTNQVMSPAVTVEATDANNNRDLDVAGSASIASAGTMTGPVTATLVSGFGTAGNIVHTAAGVSLALTASYGSLADGTSSTFSILAALAAGDILFLGYGSDDPDKFAFLVMKNMTDGTQVSFTDNGWNGTLNTLGTTENTGIYTVPAGGLIKGTVIQITGTTVTGGGTMSAGLTGLSTTGDQILAYQGTSTSPSFIAGISTTGWITTGTPTSNQSYLPSPLALYSSALGFPTEEDNGYYSGPMTLTNSAAAALICNPANHTRSAAIQTFPAWSFTLGNATIIDVTATAQDFTIGSIESCTVNGAKGFTVSGTLANSGGTSGLVVKNGGSLIEYTTGIDASVELYLTEGATGSPDNFKSWHYISSPVVDATAGVFTGDYLRSYDEPNNQWSAYFTHSFTLLNETQGYAVNALTSGTRNFSGKLNAGDITTTPALTLTGTKDYGWNLVGNPYASRIDLNSPGIVWTNVAQKVYYLDKTAGNYKVWPAGTPYGTGTRYPEPGQGFFVYVQSPNTTGTIKFTDAARTHTTDASSQFYKESVSDLLSLKAESFNGLSDQILVCFRPDATPGYDETFDCFKLSGDEEAPQMYSVTPGSSQLTINSLPYEGINTVVPVGFSVKSNGTGTYTITAENLESFAQGTAIILEDKKESRLQELTSNPVYSFTYSNGDDHARFVLHFHNPFYGIGDNGKTNDFSVYSSGDRVYVKDLTGQALKGEMTICNMIGQEVGHATLSNVSAGSYQFDLPSGYYIVRIVTSDKSYNSKVFLD